MFPYFFIHILMWWTLNTKKRPQRNSLWTLHLYGFSPCHKNAANIYLARRSSFFALYLDAGTPGSGYLINQLGFQRARLLRKSSVRSCINLMKGWERCGSTSSFWMDIMISGYVHSTMCAMQSSSKSAKCCSCS